MFWVFLSTVLYNLTLIGKHFLKIEQNENLYDAKREDYLLGDKDKTTVLGENIRVDRR